MKFPEYDFHMNTNLMRDLEICISVSLKTNCTRLLRFVLMIMYNILT